MRNIRELLLDVSLRQSLRWPTVGGLDDFQKLRTKRKMSIGWNVRTGWEVRERDNMRLI